MSNLNSIINVQITRETKVPSQTGFGEGAFVSNDAVFEERIKAYSSLEEIQADTLVGADTAAFAARYFGQEVSPEQMYVIKKGRALGAVIRLTFAGAFVTGNSVTVDVNGSDVVEAFDTDTDTTLTALAASIAAEDDIASAVANTTLRTITVTSDAGVALSIDSAVVTGGASQTTATITRLGYEDAVLTYVESIVAAQEINNDWYGLAIASRLEADVLAVSAVIEAQTKLFFTASADSAIIGSGSGDIGSQLEALSYDRTAVIYSGVAATDWPEAALMGGQLAKEPGSITWAYKRMVGITPDNLSTTAENNALGKNVNIYVTVAGLNITKFGTMASGEYIDVMHGSDFIAVRMQEEIFFILANAAKVPFTNAGISLIENAMRRVLKRAERQSIIAADPEFTISSPDASEVSAIDKGNRLLPDMEFEATLAGAVHKTEIRGRLVL